MKAIQEGSIYPPLHSIAASSTADATHASSAQQTIMEGLEERISFLLDRNSILEANDADFCLLLDAIDNGMGFLFPTERIEALQFAQDWASRDFGVYMMSTDGAEPSTPRRDEEAALVVEVS